MTDKKTKANIITENIDVKFYINEYIKELKYKDIVVESLDEALKLLEDYKKSGEYDWFRGQTGLWPLIPTMARLSNDEEFKKAEEKLKRFDNWAYKNNISDDFDYIEAIAQHYGNYGEDEKNRIKTFFLDFTVNPKIAAYFASYKINYKEYESSCIYCLNIKKFNNAIEVMKKYYPNLPSYPRLLDIDIPNLWRLESQEGKFMYQPCIGLDFFHSLHRIVFKVKEKDIQLFDESYIYPKVKSPLEERLDGFFLNERTHESLARTYNFIEELKKNGTHLDILHMDNKLYIKEFISNERKLLEHKWEQENLEQWDNKIVEKYEDVYTTEKIFFEIDSFKNIEQNKVVIYEQIIKLLNNKDIRKKAIKFTITDNEKHIELIDKFEEYSNLIWNGMRKLPYENDEIAKVMSDLIQIIDVSISEYEKSDKDFLKIGFSDITGAGNDAFVNENFLYEAMRDDLKDCIVENTKDVMTLIYHIRSPQLLYKFEALKKLFVESIILSQVVYGGNNFVIYSPTEVRVFGLP